MSEVQAERLGAGPAPAPAFDAFRHGDGLEVLLAMQRGDIPSTNASIWMHFSIEVVERGHVVYAMRPHVELYNLIGSVHGGFISTVMDSALGSAVQSLLPAGVIATTMDLHTRFHKPVTAATPRVLADARVVHCGKRSATATAQLVDDEGRLYATGTSTLMILEGSVSSRRA